MQTSWDGRRLAVHYKWTISASTTSSSVRNDIKIPIRMCENIRPVTSLQSCRAKVSNPAGVRRGSVGVSSKRKGICIPVSQHGNETNALHSRRANMLALDCGAPPTSITTDLLLGFLGALSGYAPKLQREQHFKDQHATMIRLAPLADLHEWYSYCDRNWRRSGFKSWYKHSGNFGATA